MRKLLLPAAAAAALLAVAPMTAASAASHDVLTISKVGGPNVKVGALLQSGLKFRTPAVFAAGAVRVTCKTVTFTDKVTNNPSKPGTAVEKLLKQNFVSKSCTVTGISGATGVHGVKINNLPLTTTIKDSKGFPVKVSTTNTTISVNTDIGVINCVYTAKATNGNASNTLQTITFSNQPFKKVSGPNSTCPSKGTFSAKFGPVVDSSVKGRPHVFVN